MEVAPRHPAYRLKLAAAMNKAHDFEGAARALEGGTALDPDDAHLHLRLAQQYQMMGRQLDFEREFQKFNRTVGGKGRAVGAPPRVRQRTP